MKGIIVMLLVLSIVGCTQQETHESQLVTVEFVHDSLHDSPMVRTFEVNSPQPNLFEMWARHNEWRMEQDKWDAWVRGEDEDVVVVGDKRVDGVASLRDCLAAQCY